MDLLSLFGDNSKQQLCKFGPYLLLTKNELYQKFGISVAEPEITYDPRGFFEKRSFKGGIIFTYGEEGEFAYIVHVYKTEESAHGVYINIKKDIKAANDSVLEELNSPMEFILAESKNKIGKENLSYYFRYKRYLILIMLMSASAKLSVDKIKSVGNLLIQKCGDIDLMNLD